jgi:hypothetical protein
MPAELKEVGFTLHEVVDGRTLTLDNVDISTLRGFLQEVETLIKGDAKGVTLTDSKVVLDSGSVVVRTFLSLVLAASVEHDLSKLEQTRDLDMIQSNRAKIIAAWQARASKSSGCYYQIRALNGNLVLRLRDGNRYQHRGENGWVATKKYLTGEVLDVGGTHNTNLHLHLPDGETHRIDLSRQQILEIQDNLVFREVTVYVGAEQHLVTKNLRNIKLIEYVKPPDEAKPGDLEELWKNGRVAWAGVSSASQWVNEMRGNQ